MSQIADLKCADCGQPTDGSDLISLRARHAYYKPLCGPCSTKRLGTCGCGKPATTRTFGAFEGMGAPTPICSECLPRIEMGDKTLRQVFVDLAKQLEVEGLIDESFGPADRFTGQYDCFQAKARDLQCRWIACFAVTGANEGWYIHVDAVLNGYGEGGKTTIQHLALGKTFLGREHAFRIAARAATLLGA